MYIWRLPLIAFAEFATIVLNAVIAVAAAGAMVASYRATERWRPRRQGR